MIEALLDGCVESLCASCGDEEERALLDAVLAPMSYSELLNVVTMQTMELLRARVTDCSQPLFFTDK